MKKFNHYMIVLCAMLLFSIGMYLIFEDSIPSLIALFK